MRIFFEVKILNALFYHKLYNISIIPLIPLKKRNYLIHLTKLAPLRDGAH